MAGWVTWGPPGAPTGAVGACGEWGPNWVVWGPFPVKSRRLQRFGCSTYVPGTSEMHSNATWGHPFIPQGPSPGPPHPGLTEGPNRCYFSANRAAPANQTIPVPAYHAPIGSPKSQPIPCPNGAEPRSGGN